MATIEYQTQINAPPEKVFGYVADLEKHVEWAHLKDMEKTSDGPVGVGTTYESHGEGPGGSTTNDKVEVTEHQPNERFAWRSDGPMNMQFAWSFELRPQDGGTLLIERLDPPGGLLATAILKLFAERTTRKAMPEGLAKIKEKLEAS